MVEIDDRLVDSISIHDEAFGVTDLVRTLERHHVDGGGGVSRETVEAYAAELGYDLDRLNREIDDRLTDSSTWEPGGKLYRIDGDLSDYPSSWRDALSDPADFRPLIKRMQDEVSKPEGTKVAVTEDGVSRHSVLLAAEVIAGIDRREGERTLRRQRREGQIRTSADQNPEGTVWVP